MPGDQIVKRYFEGASRNELPADESRCSQDLSMASLTVDRKVCLTILAEAERTGQRVGVTYPINLRFVP